MSIFVLTNKLFVAVYSFKCLIKYIKLLSQIYIIIYLYRTLKLKKVGYIKQDFCKFYTHTLVFMPVL